MSQLASRIPALTVAALGVTQIVGYGTLYYSFSILASGMAADLDLSRQDVFAVFSAALLAGGLIAPLMGRWMDVFGAARIMVAGSAISALLLVFSAWSPSLAFFMAGIVAMQIASGMVQYQAAFATLVENAPGSATRSITYLTLIGGFASTIFWPITTGLNAILGWRSAYLVFAGLNLLLCLPLHVWIARHGGGPQSDVHVAARQPVSGVLAPQQRFRGLVIVALAFALHGFALSSLLTHMVPMLQALGLGSAAVMTGSLFGPAQVASRLINMIFGTRLRPPALAMLSAGLITAGGIILALSGSWLPGAVIFAIFVGLGSGIGSIAQGSVPLYLFGSSGYGAISGRMTAARLVAGAAAPVLFALMMARLGIGNALILNSALGGASILAFFAVAAIGRPGPHATASGGTPSLP